MNTAIIYYSKHHGNTEKLLRAIEKKHKVTLIDVTAVSDADLSGYDRIGIASGIYYGSFAKKILSFAEEKLPEKKEVFLIATCGSKPENNFYNGIRRVLKEKNCTELGQYMCLGHDSYGPLKLIGGLKKGHPTEEEIAGAAAFYEGLRK